MYKTGMNLGTAMILATTVLATGSAGATGGQLVVRGQVTSHGQPVAGTTVRVYAMPRQAVLAALKIGRKVPEVLVVSAITNPQGRYSASVDPAALAPEATDGLVNLSVRDGSSSYGLPVAIARNGGNATIPMATGTRTANLALPDDSPPVNCPMVYSKSMGHHLTRVGQTYIPHTNHATAKFVYVKSQSSSLGVGDSPSGKFGTYSFGGTMGWSTTITQPYPANRAYASWWYYTQFHYAKYAVVCDGHLSGWQVQVNGYFGGAARGKPTWFPKTPAGYCAHYIAGSGPTIDNSAAWTWSAGATLPKIGFNVQATTGYDTDSEITFGLTAGRWICGQKGPPGAVPKQLVVRKQRN
jgi:hypothetical protein